MFRSIPWDVRIAGVLAVASVLAAFVEPTPAIFILIYVFLCGYVIVKVTAKRPPSNDDDAAAGT